MDKIKTLFGGLFLASNALFFSVLIIVILIAALFFQRDKMQREMDVKVKFIEEKNILRDELDDLIDSHEDLLNEYGHLNDQLYAKDSMIQKQITQIRGLIRTENDLNEAREKIEKLKGVARTYLADIDSLIVLNDQLTVEKDSVIKVNANINWKNYNLNKKNEELANKVSRGSVLKVSIIEVKTLKVGYFKERKTSRAKNVKKVTVSLKVASNQISDAEMKTIYMQLINPQGQVIQGADSINVFIADSLSSATAFLEFDYDNKETDVFIEWQRIDPLQPGNYLLNLILEGSISAYHEIILK